MGTLPEHDGLVPSAHHQMPRCSVECTKHRHEVKERLKRINPGTTNRAKRRKIGNKERKTEITKKQNKIADMDVPCLEECALNKQTVKDQVRIDEKKNSFERGY